MNPHKILRWFVPSLAFLRVSAYAVFAFSVAALLAARVLYANVKEAAMSVGHELLQVADLLDGVETILLNGERLHHASTYVEQDLSVVLDRFEGYCASSPSAMGRAIKDFAKEAAKKAETIVPTGAARLGIIRQGDDEQGMILCFVDDRQGGVREFKERLDRFLRTKRLGEFGRFRYLYAEKKGSMTHVVTTWADTGLDLRAMFPTEGDAAGADSRLVPRPPNARRTLSAAADGVPYGLWMYASSERADAIASFYDEFAKRGEFRRVESPDAKGATSMFLRADGHQFLITLGEENGQTFVTVTEAGSLERSNMAAVRVESE